MPLHQRRNNLFALFRKHREQCLTMLTMWKRPTVFYGQLSILLACGSCLSIYGTSFCFRYPFWIRVQPWHPFCRILFVRVPASGFCHLLSLLCRMCWVAKGREILLHTGEIRAAKSRHSQTIYPNRFKATEAAVNKKVVTRYNLRKRFMS